ncbi:MAG: DUF2089 domain-containing protein [Ardenticatenia bacterium]|nr:DUF2089 domain-containing protein [Ardenticatenia bacterium]
MHNVPVTCPFCQHPLVATGLHCFECDTSFQGHFSLEHVAAFNAEQWPVLKRLARLTPEQLRFVEIFLRCEGKITRVEEELGMSYPAVRARLNDVVRVLGARPSLRSEPDRPQLRDIVDRLERGELSPEEATALLKGKPS